MIISETEIIIMMHIKSKFQQNSKIKKFYKYNKRLLKWRIKMTLKLNQLS